MGLELPAGEILCIVVCVVIQTVRKHRRDVSSFLTHTLNGQAATEEDYGHKKRKNSTFRVKLKVKWKLNVGIKVEIESNGGIKR